jgi:2-oxoisovalerate dehydrogenase E2 component (dihydrolipoyl transacylase)
MTPAIRRLVRERGVDVSAITGSGLGGRITRADVEHAAGQDAGGARPGPLPGMPTAPIDGASSTGAPAAASTTAPAATAAAGTTATAATAAASPASTAATAAAASAITAASASAAAGLAALGPSDSPVRDGDSLKQLSPMRRAIAAQMTRSLEVPVAYITIEVDMTPVVRTRAALNDSYKAREGVGLSYVAYVTKACVEALRRHHDLNAHWTPEGHWRRKDINIGIAVAVPDGLVVPVIRKAQDLSLHGLNAAINDLASRARSKRLRPEDLEGGTFTVDNTGWTGSILTLPIINVPEVAIVTMEKIVKRPVILEHQGDAIAVRSMMNMCIAIDHRATDGAQAGAFLADVASWLGAVSEQTPIW